MALILAHDILYLHIPKTGGNWMTRTLEDQGLVRGRIGHKHATYDALCEPRRYGTRRRIDKLRWKIRPVLTGLSAQPRLLCVVRHPLRWYESWFRYRASRDWAPLGAQGDLERWHVNSDLNDAASEEFNDFMRRINRETPGYVSQLFARYTYNSGAHVLHNERLAEELVAFLQGVGARIDAEAILSSGRVGESPRMRIEWNPDVLAETVANDRPAFLRYGYNPDEAPQQPGTA